jgi:haloalkane dehalogenase
MESTMSDRVLRTPEERFADLPGMDFSEHRLEVPCGLEDGPESLRIHYLDEGPRDAAPVLLLHGEPSWCFLYRKMIPALADAGHRVLVPDLIGFGRSDKPARQEDYTYQRHVDWVRSWLEQLDLRDISLFCQDWGGLIGLRLAAEHENRFARVAVGNTGLPTGEGTMPEAFQRWQQFSRESPVFEIGAIVQGGTATDLPPEVIAGYDAPFPDDSFKAGARIFPSLVPTSPDQPGAVENREAWKVLARWQKPFLTLFSDSDPITAGGERVFQERVPGAQGQPHATIEGGGHFLQEDRGEVVAQHLVDFIGA